jgi:hypothetical protein
LNGPISGSVEQHINAEDERSITGVQNQQKISEMYAKEDAE